MGRLQFYIRIAIDDVASLFSTTVDILEVVLPPILLFILLTADIEITAATINSGLAVEINPTKQHFNDGVDGIEIYNAGLFNSMLSTAFLLISVLHRTKPKYRLVTAPVMFLFYLAIVFEAWVVLHNIFQLQQALAVLKATKVLQ